MNAKYYVYSSYIYHMKTDIKYMEEAKIKK